MSEGYIWNIKVSSLKRKKYFRIDSTFGKLNRKNLKENALYGR